jgi:hypothetical protein
MFPVTINLSQISSLYMHMPKNIDNLGLFKHRSSSVSAMTSLLLMLTTMIGSSFGESMHLLSSVRVKHWTGFWVKEMRIGTMTGSADVDSGLGPPRFITSGHFDWKPMYSPGESSMVTFVRTADQDYDSDPQIRVFNAADGTDLGTLSLPGQNYNPTWLRGDEYLSDSLKRVVWVRFETWQDVDVEDVDKDQVRAAAYVNRVGSQATGQTMLTDESILYQALLDKRESVFDETDDGYNVYTAHEWPMSSLHDGRVLILRQFEAYSDKVFGFKRWTELWLLTIGDDGSSVSYEDVSVPTGWGDDSWVHKIYVSSTETFVTYQRNGNEGEDHEQSSLCYASFDADTRVLSDENCFVENDESNGVTDWYARPTQDESHIVFSSNRNDGIYRVWGYDMETEKIRPLTQTSGTYEYWYPSTYGMTTYYNGTAPTLPPTNYNFDNVSDDVSDDSFWEGFVTAASWFPILFFCCFLFCL